MNLILDANEIDPDATDVGWWIDGNVIWNRQTLSETRYSLPKGNRRVTTERLGNGQARLTLGGFKTVTFSVVGPRDAILQLRGAVL
jgi:hypothetical protein